MSEVKFPPRVFANEDIEDGIDFFEWSLSDTEGPQYLSLQEHNHLLSQLEERLRIATEALEYCERRTDPEQKNPVEDHYIRSTRLRGVVVKALAAIKEKK